MTRFNSKVASPIKNTMRFVLIGVSILIISLLFPTRSGVINYSVGDVWSGPEVTAQEDILIDNQNPDQTEDPNGLPLVTAETISKGTKIVSNGQIINKSTLVLLRANDELVSSSRLIPSNWLNFAGYLILTCLAIGALILFCRIEYPEVYESNYSLAFLLMWPVLFAFMVYFIEDTDNLSSYMIPFCIVPIVVKNFFTDRLALFHHIVMILIVSFLSKLGYEFTFLQILAGIVTVLVVSETRYWNKFFSTILIIFGVYILGYFGLSAIKANSFADLNLYNFGWLALASFLALLAYPFTPLLEKIFGFTSSITLAELTDMNNPLIKRMSIEAQGTLQHSLQVSNLSEAAADKIGANSLLIKAAALYHDIGKLNNPAAFIENQSPNNPHNNWNNFESAKAIIDHVIEGEKIAKKARLPKVIIDFITSHHGTTRVEYFYRNQLKAEPDREFDETLFRYPGPLPKTKEEAILMIADSLEAASKSLKTPTGQDIDNLVEKIIAHKIDNGQLHESSLTFKELEQCKEVFKSLLKSINHVRIEYPDEVKKAAKAVASTSVADQTPPTATSSTTNTTNTIAESERSIETPKEVTSKSTQDDNTTPAQSQAESPKVNPNPIPPKPQQSINERFANKQKDFDK